MNEKEESQPDAETLAQARDNGVTLHRRDQSGKVTKIPSEDQEASKVETPKAYENGDGQ